MFFERHPEFARLIRPLGPITLALGLSPLVALVAMAFLRMSEPLPGTTTGGVLTWVVLGLGIVVPPVAFRISRSILERTPAAPSPATLAQGFIRSRIVRAALLEGVGMLGAVTHFIEGTIVPAAVCVVMCALVVAGFPTENRVAEAVDGFLK